MSETTHHYYHPDGVIKQVSEQDETDSWYFQARDIERDYVINIDNETADRSRLSIFVNYRVMNEQGRFVGIIGVGLSMDTVISLIESYQQRYGREVYFVDRHGQVMLQSTQYSEQRYADDKSALNNVLSELTKTPSASASFEIRNGNVIYLNSRLVSEFNWFLIVEQINDPVSQRVEAALWINLLVSLAISILVLFIAHLALRGYQGKLETMASRDKLTGLTSRQVFDGLFKQAVANCERNNKPLSLVLMDIDYFKQVNDTYGHPQGDRILQAMARVIKSHTRDSDVVCRWGGEEFLLMLPSCDLDQAINRIETIRKAIAELKFDAEGDKFQITTVRGYLCTGVKRKCQP